MTNTPNNPSMKKKTINIREAIKKRIREIDNQPVEEISLLEKAGRNIRNKLDAEEIKKRVMSNQSPAKQFYISEETLKNYISERVRIEFRQILLNAV